MKRDGFCRAELAACRIDFEFFTCLGTEDDRQGDEAEICRGHCG